MSERRAGSEPAVRVFSSTFRLRRRRGAAADDFRAFFLDLKEALERLIGRPVDLVELHTARNRRLRRYIEQSKSAVYPAA